MKVCLRPDIFASPTSDLVLLSIFKHGVDGRHRVFVDAPSFNFEGWLSGQSITVKEEVSFALDSAAKAEALSPSKRCVAIGLYAQTIWAAAPPKIRLADASLVLDAPFELLLEDRESDKNFLLAMMTHEEREYLKARIQSQFVRVEHGGGVGSMKVRMEQLQNDPMSPHLMWVMFDSDALQPGEPSAQSQQLRTSCGSVPHFQTDRRFSESYLTKKALSSWASRRTGTLRRQAFDALEAFANMTATQRHHFNMKSGFNRDAMQTDRNAGTLYAELPESARRILADGFGSNVGDLFGEDLVTEADLRKEGTWDEVRPRILELLERVR